MYKISEFSHAFIHFLELKFSNDVMNNAVAVLHKIENFINDCHNYIIGNWDIGKVDEVTLLHVSYLVTLYCFA